VPGKPLAMLLLGLTPFPPTKPHFVQAMRGPKEGDALVAPLPTRQCLGA
jgi:hypothetical protein